MTQAMTVRDLRDALKDVSDDTLVIVGSEMNYWAKGAKLEHIKSQQLPRHPTDERNEGYYFVVFDQSG